MQLLVASRLSWSESKSPRPVGQERGLVAGCEASNPTAVGALKQPLGPERKRRGESSCWTQMRNYSPQLLAQVGTPDGGSASESARCDVHDTEAVSVQKKILGSSWVGALEVAVQDVSLLPTSSRAHSLARCSLGVQHDRG